jgi:ubiquinone/menaquinone biosynthesis C-methylase UbiE
MRLQLRSLRLDSPRLRSLRLRPRQTDEPEWMDIGGFPPDLIADNLGDLRRVNRLMGGVRLTLHPLRRLLRGMPAGRPARVLDVASGGADIPRQIARWARRAGQRVWLVASDANPEFLAISRRLWPDEPGLVFIAADALRLPFADGAFDMITSSLALHHMLPPQAARMLSEMRRCAARGVILNDIVRSWIGYAGAILATTFGSRNALTKHDGPLSVRRAYTTREMASLARDAGLIPERWDSFVLYRVAMTAIPSVAPSPTWSRRNGQAAGHRLQPARDGAPGPGAAAGAAHGAAAPAAPGPVPAAVR